MAIRPTELVVDLAALQHNLGVVRKLVHPLPVCAVVKANAYGHGAVVVAQKLAALNINWLAVALVEEAIALRDAGIQTPLLVLAGALAGGYREIVEQKLTPVIFSSEHLEGLSPWSRQQPVNVHLKIDTGMGRLGVREDELPAFLLELKKYPTLNLEGVLSHFANADLANREFNGEQLACFERCCALIAKAGFKPRYLHLANSAATLVFANAYQKLVRPGLMLYGLDPMPSLHTVALSPVASLHTRAVFIKDVRAGTPISYGGRFRTSRPSRIATLPLGYADGYPRIMSGKAHVLWRGFRAPVVGTICMDLCMVDVTDVENPTLADDVVMLGSAGAEKISAHDWAAWASTIPYEIVCGIAARVPRRYVDQELLG